MIRRTPFSALLALALLTGAATAKSLSDLVGDGYRIRGNLGTALILQKGASVFSCQIPPDPENLDFKPYFVCAELNELPRAPEGRAQPPRSGH